MKAVLVGATGLTGSYLLQHLLRDDYFDKVITLTRKPLPLADSRYTNLAVRFDDYHSLAQTVDADSVIFVAVGTTQQKVKGDKAAYRAIDFDIPVNMAKIAKEKGAPTFVLVSSVGANADGGNFYIRLKGEIESVIGSIGISSVYFMRPSMLLGDRKESRTLEKVASVVMAPLSALFFGKLRKFKSIHVKDLSSAMLQAAKESRPGNHVLHYDDMMNLKR